MWEWWNKMEEIDPQFQWKTPIQFYGRVIDQFEEPVAGASVKFVWSIIGGASEKKERSASDGTFSLTGAQGKGLTVTIHKDGYLPSHQAMQSFEFAEFFNDQFYVPAREAPVVFRLRKLTGAEPIAKYLANTEFSISGAPVVLNVETGKIEESGDIAVIAAVVGAGSRNGPDYAITLRALNGAGFAISDDEFLFLAPASGYRSEETITQLASQSGYNLVRKARFYVRTRSGNFAAVELETTLYDLHNGGKAGFHALVYYNPSGSRNLEFDQKKMINR